MALVPDTVKVYDAEATAVAAEVEVNVKKALGAVGVSVMDDGEKVKLVLMVVVPVMTPATGVMVMLLYGGIDVRSKVSGAVDDNEDVS